MSLRKHSFFYTHSRLTVFPVPITFRLCLIICVNSTYSARVDFSKGYTGRGTLGSLTWPPNHKQQSTNIVKDVPLRRGWQCGVGTERFRRCTNGVKQVEGGISQPQELVRDVSEQGEGVEGVSDDFGRRPGEKHAGIKRIGVDLA